MRDSDVVTFVQYGRHRRARVIATHEGMTKPLLALRLLTKNGEGRTIKGYVAHKDDAERGARYYE